MSISRALRMAVLSWAIGLCAVTSVGAALQDKPRSGCDASVEFKARDGEVDAKAYKRVKRWLSDSREISSFEETPPRADGALKLCITAASKEGIRPVYTALMLLVDRSYGGGGMVRVQNRYGGLFDKKRVKSYGTTPGVPRNNGLPQRPPSDKWN